MNIQLARLALTDFVCIIPTDMSEIWLSEDWLHMSKHFYMTGLNDIHHK